MYEQAKHLQEYVQHLRGGIHMLGLAEGKSLVVACVAPATADLRNVVGRETWK